MNRWTEQEILMLMNNYNKLSNEDLIKLFPNRTFIAIYKKARNLGLYKEPEIEFVNRSIVRKGSKCPNWKGGNKKNYKGYILRLEPNHHRADVGGYVMEHIYIFEKYTGISIPDNCVIHHLNGNKSDNRIENLCLMERGAHTIYHHKRKDKKWTKQFWLED